jgi:hypothetical protein
MLMRPEVPKTARSMLSIQSKDEALMMIRTFLCPLSNLEDTELFYSTNFWNCDNNMTTSSCTAKCLSKDWQWLLITSNIFNTMR